MSTDKRSTFSKEKVMNALVIASSYIAAQMLAGGLCVTQN
jgi:hypothetical protein